MCVGCFGLVVSTCQVIGYKGHSDDTFTCLGDYLHKAQVEEIVCVCVFYWVCLCCYVFSLALHNIYFIHLWNDIAFCAESAVKHQTNNQLE